MKFKANFTSYLHAVLKVQTFMKVYKFFLRVKFENKCWYFVDFRGCFTMF
jgi:hypothetical protein